MPPIGGTVHATPEELPDDEPDDEPDPLDEPDDPLDEPVDPLDEPDDPLDEPDELPVEDSMGDPASGDGLLASDPPSSPRTSPRCASPGAPCPDKSADVNGAPPQAAAEKPNTATPTTRRRFFMGTCAQTDEPEPS
jgi:hypothetical protein